MEEELRKFRHSEHLVVVLKDAAKASGTFTISNIHLQLMQLICRLLQGLIDSRLARNMRGFKGFLDCF